ncbi:MAG: helix-turn-helix domain-containing protein [Pseudomonadota bacterium]|nr:helix-turn-helix domain-containing protein [Pseudomonadota bacterium]
MGLGWGLFIGHAGDAEPHAHHAVQIVLSDHPQTLWTQEFGWGQHAGFVIGPDIKHQLVPSNNRVVLLYIEPDSSVGRSVRRILNDGCQVLGSTQVQAALQALGQIPNDAAISALVSALAPGNVRQARAALGDPLIEKLIESLPQVLPEQLKTSTLAAQARLSESRFLHRFRDHTGLPLRPYLRWRRLLMAMTQVMAGQTLTNAAVTAGFSDAAHFTRTFRRHFGIAPKMLLALHSRAIGS